MYVYACVYSVLVDIYLTECIVPLPPSSEYHEALTEAGLGVAERCQLVADLYGDQREAIFWRVAQYYMLRECHRMKDPQYSVSHHIAYYNLVGFVCLGRPLLHVCNNCTLSFTRV